MRLKIVEKDVNDFSRFFRHRLRDPIIDMVISKLVDTDTKRIQLLEKIPTRLFHEIIKVEENSSLSGSDKTSIINSTLVSMLNKIEMGHLAPFIYPVVQLSIFYIYQQYFMEIFKNYGLHEMLELLLSEDLDKDGDIGEKEISSGLEEVEDKEELEIDDKPLVGLS